MSISLSGLAASGTTFAQLNAAGFGVLVENVVTVNAGSLTQNQINKVRSICRPDTAGRVFGNMAQLAMNFMSGRAVSTAEINADVNDDVVAWAVVMQAMLELQALISGNPGTLNTGPAANGNYAQTLRSWP